MPTSMPPDNAADRRTFRRWAVVVAVFYTVVAGGLFGLASAQPKFAAWISKGTQAEIANSAPADAADTVQLAAKRLGMR
jgi:hypothetical protein